MEMEECMKKIPFTFLFLTLLLGACSKSTISTASSSTENPAPIAVVTETATFTVATETAIPAREAVFSEIKNNVSARISSENEFVTAFIGMGILPSGKVETGIDGRARLDLLPEGTIIRVGPNSSFTMTEIDKDDSEPKTRIELFFGKIFILLRGGSFEVNTPAGIASVRGSLLSVEYNPEEKTVKASCLEGHCALENAGGDVVELIAGEFSYIEDGHPPISPERIDREEIQEWLDEIPELSEFLEVLPDPMDFPEPKPRDELRDPILPRDGRRPSDDDRRPKWRAVL